jgi:excisionase family DNA binding protein
MESNRSARISAEPASFHRLLAPGDVANWLGVSSGWVRDHATRKEPRLKAVKVGKLLRFRPEDVESFLKRCAETDLGESMAG